MMRCVSIGCCSSPRSKEGNTRFVSGAMMERDLRGKAAITARPFPDASRLAGTVVFEN
ncbi:MAG: hypothetical protein LC776_02285 [Acidobacteria bacterium]|nr:hypothetical protein [Acidobacteriota bacterium]